MPDSLFAAVPPVPAADIAPDAATNAPTSAAQAALRRWGRRMRRNLVVVPAICLGIAAVLTAIDGHGFFYKLLYSLCIGAICMTIVDLVRLAAAWLSDRLRSARGLPFVDDPSITGWRAVIPGALISMLVGPPLGLQLADWLTGFRSPSMLNLDSGSTRLTLAFSVLATVVSVAVLSAAERLSTARAQAEAAQRQAAENQLRLLQSQLEPHMLFNTLANLRVLIGLDAAQAQAMLDRLIGFLRATLTASRSSSQPLSAEFAHLADYLALMAMRMGTRLQVQLDLPPELAALPVPPLLLQPLVENAIKHGLEPQVEGGLVHVSARRAGNTLVLTVRDTGAGLTNTHGAAATAGTHFGLEQVRTRLATLHGQAASLTLHAAPADTGLHGTGLDGTRLDATGLDGTGRDGTGTLATIVLPLPADPPTRNPTP